MSVFPIENAVLSVLERALNSALQLDPATLNRLGELEGKTFQISCTAPPVSLFLFPQANGIKLSNRTEQATDSHISGDSSALLRLMMAENKADALFNSNIKLSGDTAAAQQLQSIFSDLDIDWEQKLSEWIGDIAAHQVGKQSKDLLRWGQNAFSSMLMNTEEYLHEEARSMPPRLEVESFYQDIEVLALAVDRLAARFERLSKNGVPAKTGKTPNKAKTKEDTNP